MKAAASLSRRNIALYVVTVLVACLCVEGGVMAWRTHEARERAQAEQERYGDVLEAASAEAEAFINIRYDDAQASVDKVAEGATGSLTEEGLTFAAPAPGRYRVEVHNWAGAPATRVDLTTTFLNSAGEPGPAAS